MPVRVCARVCILHGQSTVIFLLYYFFPLYLIINKIHNFNILPVRSDIYFFLHFNIKNMKQARFKLLTLEYRSDCDSGTFHIVDF